MTFPKKSTRMRPDRQRIWSAEDDVVIIRWCKGELKIKECVSLIHSSVHAIKPRAEYLCSINPGLTVPKRVKGKQKDKLNRKSPPKDYDAVDSRIVVGTDPLLERLQAGRR